MGEAGSDGRPVRLNRETILEAVERVAAHDGLDAVTMRRIGAVLGVDPTAVYRHFRSKDEMLLALADRAFGSLPQYEASAGWRVALRAEIDHAMRRYRTHPGFAPLLARQPDESPNLVRLTESCLEHLRAAGLDAETAARMYRVIETHVAGAGLYYSLIEYDGDPRLSDVEALRRRFATLPPDEYPACVEAAPHLFPDRDEIHAWSTELLLDSIEHLARSPEPATATDGAPRS